MPHKDPEVAKEYFRKRYLANKEEFLSACAKRYASDPEKFKAYQKEYYKNNKEKCNLRNKLYAEKNKDRLKEKSRKYWAANRDEFAIKSKKWRESNKEKMVLYRKEYSKNNRAAMNARNSKYRACQKQRTPSWADLEAIKDVYLETQYFQMQVDHIIPLQGDLVSGLHVWDNLQILSAIDNQRKNKHYDPNQNQPDYERQG